MLVQCAACIGLALTLDGIDRHITEAEQQVRINVGRQLDGALCHALGKLSHSLWQHMKHSSAEENASGKILQVFEH
jgi:hypothetical protein